MFVAQGGRWQPRPSVAGGAKSLCPGVSLPEGPVVMRDKEKTDPNPRALGWVCYKKKNKRLGSHTFILTARVERDPLGAEDMVTWMAST